MAKRLQKTLADYVAIAISPALIMTLVGSLVFFLLEVFYRGAYPARLAYILALFIFAAVLVGRISIEEGRQRAVLFAIPLAVATGLAMVRFVSIPGMWWMLGMLINFGLIALIWWCADKLTWDCTFVDDEQDAGGQGLLETVGLDEPPPQRIVPRDDGQPKSLFDLPTDGTTSPEDDDRPGHWYDRLLGRGRPHRKTQGTWVVYFSLAALPLFGLGQLLIPASSDGRRTYVFFLLCVYVASGLGLLLTTSFLNMRRYLRQRHVQMPSKMAGVWVGAGAGLVLLLLLFCAVLPRPAAEYELASVSNLLDSPDRQASRHSVGGEGTRDNENRAARKAGGEEPGDPGGSSSQGGTRSDPQGSGERRADDGSDGDGDNGTDGSDGGSGKRNDDGQDGSSDDGGASGDSQSGGGDPGGRSGGNTGSRDGQSSGGQSESDSGQRRENDDSERGGLGAEPGDSSAGSQQPQNSSQASSSSPFANVSDWVGKLFKILFYVLLIALAAFICWKYRREIRAGLAQLLKELRELWARLFGGKQEKADPAAAEAASRGPPPKRFADYADPFATGDAERWPAEVLVTYTFEALQAWARDRGVVRGEDETPHEFASQVGSRAVPLADDARYLADLYCRVAYARGRVKRERAHALRRLWGLLTGGAAA